ncbi:MAG: sensor histidine kinase [Thermoleophilaceae bacterium]
MADIAETSSTGLRRRTPTGTVVALLGVLVTAAALWLVATDASPEHRGISLVTHGLAICLPIGLGAFRLSRNADDRFAKLLVGAGLLFSLTSLAEARGAVPYSIGRVLVWVVEPVVVYLLLAFPSGRIATTVERRLVWATVLIAGVLYLPTALIAEGFPVPNPWATCGEQCPHNALALGSAAGVMDVVRPLREVLGVLVFGAVSIVLWRRTRRVRPMLQRALVPVAAIAVFRTFAIGSYGILRAADGASGLTEVIGWMYFLTLPAITICFATGIVSQRVFAAGALERLALELGPRAKASSVRVAMAEQLDDPALRVVYWLPGDPGRWIDETGWPVKAPQPENGQVVTELTAGDRLVAAVVHDAALSQDPQFVEAASVYALATLENERLIGQLRDSVGELAESRTRLVAVADEERRRIERDLHDGAQQRLVALRIKLELIAERIQDESPRDAAALRDLEDEVETTIEQVRSFARGIYPALLAERGLDDALRARARDCPLPTTVHTEGLSRYPDEIEATVYFAVAEALQNATKHARGATGATIRVRASERLEFDVHDDGSGFAPDAALRGVGLVNFRDRLDAVGGELRIRSAPDTGTTVSGSIPLAVVS